MLYIKTIRKGICLGLAAVLFLSAPPPAAAVDLVLPKPGTMVQPSPAFAPAVLAGLKIHPENPFRLDFILDKSSPTGEGASPSEGEASFEALAEKPSAKKSRLAQKSTLKAESTKLIKYFLASLTVPEKDLWVNLSPYEKDRIVPDAFGKTEMGRDLLAQDYLLKQLTASLLYPEGETGKQFWNKVYAEATKRFGNTTGVPVNTFNKVWIMPDKAVVYENAKAGTAYVVESKLKVMLEEDYRAATNNQRQPGDMFQPQQHRTCPPAGCAASEGLRAKAPQGSHLTQTILREIIIPQLNKEVNQGKNFAPLRQVYNSLILANWYKKKIKDSILAQVYSDQNKIGGLRPSRLPSKGGLTVNATEGLAPLDVDAIYQRYLEAFKKGAYNYIKEDIDPATHKPLPRKYFSGGVQLQFGSGIDSAMTVISGQPPPVPVQQAASMVEVRLDPASAGDLMAPTQEQERPVSVDPIVHELRLAWDKELAKNRPYWTSDPRFEFPYNYRAPSISYDPKNVPTRRIGPYVQLPFSRLPERDDLDFVPEDVPPGQGQQGLAREIRHSLMADPSDDDLVVVSARWPLFRHHMVVMSRQKEPQLENVRYLASAFKWAERGMAVEFHRFDDIIRHYHYQMYDVEDAPLAKHLDTFRSDMNEIDGVQLGAVERWPVPHFALTALNVDDLQKATWVAQRALEQKNILFYRDILRNRNGQLFALFFILTGQEVGFRFNTLGHLRSDDFGLTARQMEDGFSKMFSSRERLAQLQDDIWKQWKGGGGELVRAASLMDVWETRLRTPYFDAPVAIKRITDIGIRNKALRGKTISLLVDQLRHLESVWDDKNLADIKPVLAKQLWRFISVTRGVTTKDVDDVLAQMPQDARVQRFILHNFLTPVLLFIPSAYSINQFKRLKQIYPPDARFKRFVFYMSKKLSFVREAVADFGEIIPPEEYSRLDHQRQEEYGRADAEWRKMTAGATQGQPRRKVVVFQPSEDNSVAEWGAPLYDSIAEKMEALINHGYFVVLNFTADGLYRSDRDTSGKAIMRRLPAAYAPLAAVVEDQHKSLVPYFISFAGEYFPEAEILDRELNLIAATTAKFPRIRFSFQDLEKTQVPPRKDALFDEQYILDQDRRVYSLRDAVPEESRGFFDRTFRTGYLSAQTAVVSDGLERQEMLSRFMDYVFEQVQSDEDYRHNALMLFPQTGAEPLAEMARSMSRVMRNGLTERIRSVWANMRNNEAMMKDPEQAVLFVKYLYDQGVLRPDIKHLWMVDTDSRNPQLGTEQIFYRTLLNPRVMAEVNRRFNLALPVWNAGQGYLLRIIYMYLPSVTGADTFSTVDLDQEKYLSRMNVHGFNETGLDDADRIASLWTSVDAVSPLNSIAGRFQLRADQSVGPVKEPSYGSELAGTERRIDHHLRYAGFVMGMLNVLHARGLDVGEEVKRYLDQLRFRLSHVTDQDNMIQESDVHEAKVAANARVDAAMIQSPSVALTGATGFIGGVLTQALISGGTNAHALVLSERDAVKWMEAAPGADYQLGTLLDIDRLKALVHGKNAGAFINLAAITNTSVKQGQSVELSAEMLITNALGPAVALLVTHHEAPQMRKLFISTFDVAKVPPQAAEWVENTVAVVSRYAMDYYRYKGHPPQDLDRFFRAISVDYHQQNFKNVRPYAVSKAIMEGVLRTLAKELKVGSGEVVSLRFAGPIGVDMLKSRASGFMLKLIKAIVHSNEEWPEADKPTPYEDAKPPFIGVEDLVRVIKDLSLKPLNVPAASSSGAVLELEVEGERMRLDAVMDIIEQTARAGGIVSSDFRRNVRSRLTPADQKTAEASADMRKLEAALGAPVQITPLRQVIADMTREVIAMDKVGGPQPNPTVIPPPQRLAPGKTAPDSAQLVFQRWQERGEFIKEHPEAYARGWWIGFDMDRARYLAHKAQEEGISIMNGLMQEVLGRFRLNDGTSPQFFSAYRTSNARIKEEGVIYLPGNLEQDDLSAALREIQRRVRDQTGATLTFAAVRAADLPAKVEGNSDIAALRGGLPRKSDMLLEDLVPYLLRKGKGDRLKEVGASYGNAIVFAAPTDGVDTVYRKPPGQLLAHAHISVRHKINEILAEIDAPESTMRAFDDVAALSAGLQRPLRMSLAREFADAVENIWARLRGQGIEDWMEKVLEKAVHEIRAGETIGAISIEERIIGTQLLIQITTDTGIGLPVGSPHTVEGVEGMTVLDNVRDLHLGIQGKTYRYEVGLTAPEIAGRFQRVFREVVSPGRLGQALEDMGPAPGSIFEHGIFDGTFLLRRKPKGKADARTPQERTAAVRIRFDAGKKTVTHISIGGEELRREFGEQLFAALIYTVMAALIGQGGVQGHTLQLTKKSIRSGEFMSDTPTSWLKEGVAAAAAVESTNKAPDVPAVTIHLDMLDPEKIVKAARGDRAMSADRGPAQEVIWGNGLPRFPDGRVNLNGLAKWGDGKDRGSPHALVGLADLLDKAISKGVTAEDWREGFETFRQYEFPGAAELDKAFRMVRNVEVNEAAARELQEAVLTHFRSRNAVDKNAVARLESRWREILRSIGIGDPDPAVFDKILAHYQEKHRGYHGLGHPVALFRVYDRVFKSRLSARGAAEIAAFQFAILLHDVIYNGQPGADERWSAELAQELLQQLHVPQAIIDRVQAYIAVTVTHEVSRDRLLQIFCDLDMFPFAAPQAIFEQNNLDVEAELKAMGVYDVSKRTAYLERLLQKAREGTFFYQPKLNAHYGARVIANIEGELARLQGGMARRGSVDRAMNQAVAMEDIVRDLVAGKEGLKSVVSDVGIVFESYHAGRSFTGGEKRMVISFYGDTSARRVPLFGVSAQVDIDGGGITLYARFAGERNSRLPVGINAGELMDVVFQALNAYYQRIKGASRNLVYFESPVPYYAELRRHEEIADFFRRHGISLNRQGFTEREAVGYIERVPLTSAFWRSVTGRTSEIMSPVEAADAVARNEKAVEIVDNLRELGTPQEVWEQVVDVNAAVLSNKYPILRNYSDMRQDIIDPARKVKFAFAVDRETHRMIGYVFYERMIRSVYVSYLAVRPEFRVRGLGVKLMEKVFDFAHGEGNIPVALDTPSGDNPAIKFYASLPGHIAGVSMEAPIDANGQMSFRFHQAVGGTLTPLRGGIDLTPAQDLQVQSGGEAIRFHIDPAQLEELRHASGFTPVILNIRPLPDVRLFLGLQTDPQSATGRHPTT